MTFDKFQKDRRVMERTCRCLRFALRLIGKQSAPLLQPLVAQVTSIIYYNFFIEFKIYPKWLKKVEIIN